MANTQSDSRKLWWLIILLLVITAGMAATNVYLLARGDQVAGTEEKAEPVESETPLFVEIAPFTVNLQTDGYGNRLLYTGVSLQVGNEETREFLLQHMPQLRSRLLTLFSGQEAEALISPPGKRQLADSVLAMLEEPMAVPQPELAVRDVLFTEFIVQ
ncbi:flagellar basal body-associated protein FliL [Parahaliea mediterranea]|uniref:Flagellar protein FliL n=1 Tax=Parahaliea mediterranea TaxID=651086 RepID=A0A939DCS1_9GAMM|nr:flagellar basal body-associated protein FliL [Parahaliea mediterranea]MBN7795833.1 flagellar basal body-associated protein FliL [Parahaliea mediterranea]